MTDSMYNTLWHFTEKLTRDPDDRQELVLMAWKEMERGGGKKEIPWLINVMKLRSREMNKRCALGAKISGKSQRDAWNHERVSLSKPVGTNSKFALEDTISCTSGDPLSMCIVEDFEKALPGLEHSVAEGIVSGYNSNEISRSLGISRDRFAKTKHAVQEKAMKYLV
jgi:hypothetical protein